MTEVAKVTAVRSVRYAASCDAPFFINSILFFVNKNAIF
jgi:hypothetical protein